MPLRTILIALALASREAQFRQIYSATSPTAVTLIAARAADGAGPISMAAMSLCRRLMLFRFDSDMRRCPRDFALTLISIDSRGRWRP